MAAAPQSLTIRSYNVGFGDCYLLSFKYAKKEKHVLIDFGSTRLPKGYGKDHMKAVAANIKERTKDKLHAVVATHRHKDHISGFDTSGGKTSSGQIIANLKPEAVVQPWTEDPDLDTRAIGPKSSGAERRVSGLRAMNSLAAWVSTTELPTYFSAQLRRQLSFLGENNIKNKSAVKNLMEMTKNKKKNHYVSCGSKSGLESILPGVKIDVLGPPTVEQTDTIKKQRSKDPNEFWHLAAKMARAVDLNNDKPKTLFSKSHVKRQGPASRCPVDTRWFIYHSQTQRTDQFLKIVRMLDDAMNNTSVILLFRIGKKHILFPGDAQIENWQYALNQPKYEKLLKEVDVYKVGHHGSLNATPRTLWGLFKKRRKTAGTGRIRTLMSTMEHVHGDENSKTEVPRKSLTNELKRESDHFTTQTLKKSTKFYEDFTI
jgi:beta-lactamase superfamily II metal-dependent hydrolase